MSRRDATAVLLAGGLSTRMGRDKALLPWDGRTLIEHLHAQLSDSFEEVLVASGTPDRYLSLGIRGVDDAAHFQGPMAGIVAAFRAATYPLAYVHPCDAPEVDGGIVDTLFEVLDASNGAAVVRTPDGVQPLCAVYRIAPALEVFSECAGEGRFALHGALARLHAAEVALERPIVNLNTPGDLPA